MNDNDRLPGRVADAGRGVTGPGRLAGYEASTRDPLDLLADRRGLMEIRLELGQLLQLVPEPIEVHLPGRQLGYPYTSYAGYAGGYSCCGCG